MNEIYIKRLKIKLKKVMESGMLSPEQQIAAIDDTLDKLAIDDNYAETVEKFEKTIEEIVGQLTEIEQKKPENILQNKLFENYKKIYDNIMKDI